MPKSIASGLNKTNYGDLCAPLDQYIVERSSLAKERHMYDKVVPVKESRHWAKAYGGQTSLNSLFVPGGENMIYPEAVDQDDHTQIIKNDVTWKLSTKVTKEMFDDGQFEDAKLKVGKLVDSFWRTRERLCADFLTNATQDSMKFNGKEFDIRGADGKPLFAADHDSINGGYTDQSNLYDAEFNNMNLMIMESLIADQRGANGERGVFEPDTIIIPGSGIAAAKQKREILRVLNASGDPDSTDRKGQTTAGGYNIITWNFLGNPPGIAEGKSWWMLADMRYVFEEATYVLQMREKPNYKNYYNEDTDAVIYKGRARMTIKPVGWRGIVACVPGMATATKLDGVA